MVISTTYCAHMHVHVYALTHTHTNTYARTTHPKKRVWQKNLKIQECFWNYLLFWGPFFFAGNLSTHPLFQTLEVPGESAADMHAIWADCQVLFLHTF